MKREEEPYMYMGRDIEAQIFADTAYEKQCK